MVKKGFIISCMMSLMILSCTHAVKKESVLADKTFSIQRVSEMSLKLDNVENSAEKTVLAAWVIDASSGEGLPGVDVLLVDETGGAVKLKKATSPEGYFRIVSDKIDMRDKLSLQYIGYDSRTYTISELINLFTQKSR